MAFSHSYLTRQSITGQTGGPWNFTSMSFGDADAARHLVAVIEAIDPSSYEVDAVTIGGVSATIVATAGVVASTAAIAIAAVPTGTSGTVSVSLDPEPFTNDVLTVSLFRFIDLPATTPYDTAIDTTTASGVLDLSLDLPADGVWVAGAAARLGSTTTWSRGTEHSDVAVAVDDYISVASEHPVGPNTPLTLTATNADTTPGDHVGIAASWAMVLFYALTASEIVGGAPTLGSPALSESHNLVASPITGGAPILDNPDMYVYKPLAGGLHVGDGSAPYLSASGNPGVISPSGSANEATAAGNAGRNVVSGEVPRHVVGPLFTDD